MQIATDILARHHVLNEWDNEFQREARLRQALWREKNALPVGQHRGRPLGSMLAMPFAEETLANYLTPNIQGVVRAEVLKTEKMYQTPRLYENLLSSQPMCFNVFAELQLDLELATEVFRVLLREPIRVTAIEFEHSPGRGDPRFSHDGSAFDVYVRYEANGQNGFFAIEVKYAESLNVDEARHRPRYDEIERAMGIFSPDAESRLRVRPLEQFWRDHLLACSLLLDRPSGFERGQFVVLYPSRNAIVNSAVEDYRSCLTDPTTFDSWTLERVIDAMDHAGAGSWVAGLRERYLGGA